LLLWKGVQTVLLQQQATLLNLAELKNRAAVYCRWSRDDGDAQSASIATQKQMLAQYAKDNGFVVSGVYVDDGISGTQFNRSGFQKMIRDIEDGKIDIVLLKDFSRLGREHLQSGYYTEIYFEEHDIRYISVGNSIDSAKGNTEFVPIIHLMNEWYSRDISQKVRASYKQHALNGDFTAAFSPYGYKKSENDKHKLVIDENVSEVVKRVFAMAVEGYSPYKISMALRADEILTPRAYTAQQYNRYKSSFNSKHPYDWCNMTIVSMLKNRAYLGHIVNGKSTTKSFKVRKQIIISPENWIEVKNAHEPLVDEDTFELAQKVIKVKKRPTSEGEHQIFQGLLRCSTCGQSLSYAREIKRNNMGSFACNQSRRKGKAYCTFHYISYDAIYSILLDDIRRNAKIANKSEDEFVETLTALDKSKQKKQTASVRKERDKMKRRTDELQAVLKKLYEDNALGKISDEQYIELKADFEIEKSQSAKRLDELETELSRSDEKQNNTAKFLALVREHTSIKELTKPILNELIDKVVVHDAVKTNGKRTQKVDIYYRFIGKITEA
jgi:DNA invertase Pin-like site-specific DNA recombinase